MVRSTAILLARDVDEEESRLVGSQNTGRKKNEGLRPGVAHDVVGVLVVADRVAGQEHQILAKFDRLFGDTVFQRWQRGLPDRNPMVKVVVNSPDST